MASAAGKLARLRKEGSSEVRLLLAGGGAGWGVGAVVLVEVVVLPLTVVLDEVVVEAFEEAADPPARLARLARTLAGV